MDKALAQVHPVLDSLKKAPLVNGLFLHVVLTAATPKRVSHGLRRAYQGWILVDTTGTSPIYRVDAGDRSEEIWLKSAADAVVKVYLF